MSAIPELVMFVVCVGVLVISAVVNRKTEARQKEVVDIAERAQELIDELNRRRGEF